MKKWIIGAILVPAGFSLGMILFHCGGGSDFECTTNDNCDLTKNEYCDLTTHTCKTQETCKTCDQLGKECGKWDDGCGKVLNCGPCDVGTCNTKTGKCDTACVPDCEDHKCGKDPVCSTKDCGTCTAPTPTCDLSSGQCKAACVPDCGTRKCGLDPVCKSKDCGTCTAPTPTCNASGQCEAGPCTPDCQDHKCGKDPVCNTKDCGTCVAPTPKCNLETGQCAATCTEDCKDHVCGKDPVCGTKDCLPGCSEPTPVCNASGKCEACTPNCGTRQCGPVPNACGASCGSCTDPAKPKCNGATGMCEVCTPDCQDHKCGKDPVCGTKDCLPGCTGTDVCMADGTCCVKPLDPVFCSDNGKNCGSYTGTNKCGVSQTASCGTCTNSLVCAWNDGTPNVCDGPCNRALKQPTLAKGGVDTATSGDYSARVTVRDVSRIPANKEAMFLIEELSGNTVSWSEDWVLLREGETKTAPHFEVTCKTVVVNETNPELGTATFCVKARD